jgi:hypothetical protein
MAVQADDLEDDAAIMRAIAFGIAADRHALAQIALVLTAQEPPP